MNTFKNPFDPDNSQTKTLLKQWVTTKLKLSPQASVEILEHHCSDAACLHAETIFRIVDFNTVRRTPHGEGSHPEASEGDITPNFKEKLYKIAKPLVFIRKWDIDNIQPYTSTHPPISDH